MRPMWPLSMSRSWPGRYAWIRTNIPAVIAALNAGGVMQSSGLCCVVPSRHEIDINNIGWPRGNVKPRAAPAGTGAESRLTNHSGGDGNRFLQLRFGPKGLACRVFLGSVVVVGG
jgi:hypothetical protein